eukprot:13101435-Ditylum_brightwellii.AAC.1
MSTDELKVGCTVQFCKGKYADKTGTVKRLTPKQVLVVLSDETKEGETEVRVPKSSIKVIESEYFSEEDDETVPTSKSTLSKEEEEAGDDIVNDFFKENKKGVDNKFRPDFIWSDNFKAFMNFGADLEKDKP